jgi:hypothetical protein
VFREERAMSKAGRRGAVVRTGVVLAVVVVCILATVAPAFASPPTPYKPCGSVASGAVSAPNGVEVSAWIGGVQYGQPVLTASGFYSLIVPGDDPDTADVIEGGVNGQTVSFKINGQVANQTATWTSGGGGCGTSVRVNLTVNPTAVMLSAFTAGSKTGQIELAWETASEAHLLGFNVYRGVSGQAKAQGVAAKLNESLILGEAVNPALGATYGFVDAGAKAGVRYYYWLEMVTDTGAADVYGPMTAALWGMQAPLPLPLSPQVR